MPGTVKALVMDSGPLIKGAKPETITSDVYTIREVVSEIRDAATRQRLSVLPYEMKFREPAPNSIKFVSDFAKKTGDYQVLSAIDIRVMALAHQLTVESGSDAATKIRGTPVTATQGASTVMEPTTIGTGHLAGFYMPKTSSTSSGQVSRASSQRASMCEDTASGTASSTDATLDAAEEGDSPAVTAAAAAATSDCDDSEQAMREEGDGAGDGEGDGDDDDDDDEGWITPSNLSDAKKTMKGDLEEVSIEMAVGCMTTDYAMQNVLMQIGIPVLSLDGMVIRTVRSYVMRCTACLKVSTKVASAFCPKCGNDALVRVVAHTSSEGQVHYGQMGAKALNTRGVQYSLPLPKGGRLAVNPVLSADQRVSYRPPRSRNTPFDALTEDYMNSSSPFAMNDVTSRGVNIAFRNKSAQGAAHRMPGQKRVNPNASKPRKKKK